MHDPYDTEGPDGKGPNPGPFARLLIAAMNAAVLKHKRTPIGGKIVDIHQITESYKS